MQVSFHLVLHLTRERNHSILSPITQERNNSIKKPDTTKARPHSPNTQRERSKRALHETSKKSLIQTANHAKILYQNVILELVA